jgi:hypothetical protein
MDIKPGLASQVDSELDRPDSWTGPGKTKDQGE